MAYITTQDLKVYLGKEASGDDALIGDSVAAAQRFIDSHTNRFFEAQTLTKYYAPDARSRKQRRVLDVDEDLLTITELLNGDTAQTEIVAAQFWLIDRNEGPPYRAIQLTSGSNVSWTWDVDGWIEVTGTWGYMAEADGEIQQACKELAAYAYRQKDAQIFDTTAMPEAGVITIPQGVPKSAINRLKPYRKML